MSLNLRKATANDLMLYFNWANDPLVREQSFYSDPISLENHTSWFNKKLNSADTCLFVFEKDHAPAGQVRIEIDHNKKESVIGISIDKDFRGQGLGAEMLKKAGAEYFKSFNLPIFAFIKNENPASAKIFEKAGFVFVDNDTVNSIDCKKYVLSK